MSGASDTYRHQGSEGNDKSVLHYSLLGRFRPNIVVRSVGRTKGCRYREQKTGQQAWAMVLRRRWREGRQTDRGCTADSAQRACDHEGGEGGEHQFLGIFHGTTSMRIANYRSGVARVREQKSSPPQLSLLLNLEHLLPTWIYNLTANKAQLWRHSRRHIS